MTEYMFFLFYKVARDLTIAELQLSEHHTEFKPPFPQIDFLPAVESALGCSLPDLLSPNAQEQLTKLFVEKGLPIPSSPSLPRLLDQLSAHILEPQCEEPTWIINHPECMSPLSKSFLHPKISQKVSARAELFVKKHELVNTYEEENSPVEQRRKFEMQLSFNDPESTEKTVNEDYLLALECGMPPTGGWGCGIERLVMLFAGTSRIADTLSFGNLRNVVAKPAANDDNPFWRSKDLGIDEPATEPKISKRDTVRISRKQYRVRRIRDVGVNATTGSG